MTDLSSSKPPKLLDRMRDALRVRHYSYRTEQAYLDWARRYILFHGKRLHGKRHPAEMGAVGTTGIRGHGDRPWFSICEERMTELRTTGLLGRPDFPGAAAAQSR